VNKYSYRSLFQARQPCENQVFPLDEVLHFPSVFSFKAMVVGGSTLNSSNRPEPKPGLTACGGVDQAFPIVAAGEYDSRQLLAREVWWQEED